MVFSTEAMVEAKGAVAPDYDHNDLDVIYMMMGW